MDTGKGHVCGWNGNGNGMCMGMGHENGAWHACRTLWGAWRGQRLCQLPQGAADTSNHGNDGLTLLASLGVIPGMDQARMQPWLCLLL